MAVVDSVQSGLAAEERGATIVQLRAPDASTRELTRMASELAQRLDVPLLVSSRSDVALIAGAAGVNLPARDIGVEDARQLLGRDRLIGRSTHSIGEARAAAESGADYVIFGPVFDTPTHMDGPPLGITALTSVAQEVRVPVVAIGGMNLERAQQCVAAGAAGYAGIRMFR
jgi:thiamine-phosphate pyrophosphorylase